MNLKFIDESGREAHVRSIDLLLRLIRSGRIKQDTMLFDDRDSRWKRASECDLFQVARASVKPKASTSLDTNAEKASNRIAVRKKSVQTTPPATARHNRLYRHRRPCQSRAPGPAGPDIARARRRR